MHTETDTLYSLVLAKSKMDSKKCDKCFKKMGISFSRQPLKWHIGVSMLGKFSTCLLANKLLDAATHSLAISTVFQKTCNSAMSSNPQPKLIWAQWDAANKFARRYKQATLGYIYGGIKNNPEVFKWTPDLLGWCAEFLLGVLKHKLCHRVVLQC